MTALDHAMAWVQGERMEGAAVTALAVVLVVSAGLLWMFAVTAASRAMIAPLLVVGVLIVAMGIWMEILNMQRTGAFAEAHALDPSAFVEGEIARVEGFMTWYLYTMAGGCALMTAGLAAFFLAPSPMWKAIGLTMILVGVTALFVDHFSKGRAVLYLESLVQFAIPAPAGSGDNAVGVK